MRLHIFIATIVIAGLFGYKTLEQIPIDSDRSTIPQIISLIGVRKTMTRIAHKEQKHILENAGCVSLDDLTDAGEVQRDDNERSGYSFSIECSGLKFTVIGKHPLGPDGLHHGFPDLAIDQTINFRKPDED